MFKANCLPLAIGSLPHKNAKDAQELIFKYFHDIPFWPQLPQMSLKEGMYLQYSKGLPGLMINLINGEFFVQYDDGIYEKIAEFFEKIMSQDEEVCAVSEDFSAGLNEFIKQKDKIRRLNPKAVKGHITGPLSLALGLMDQNKKPIIYNDEYMEVINQLIIQKSRWQIGELKKINDNVIYFLDEPYLSSLGSGMLNLDRGRIKNCLTEVIQKIKEFGASVGVHCCGGTDWSFVMDLGAQIISFDAYNFGEEFLQYSQELKYFMENKGIIAWGIVPSNKDFEKTDKDILIKKMYKFLTVLSENGFNLREVLQNSFITPSCGMGSLNEALAENIAKMTFGISEHLKKEYSV